MTSKVEKRVVRLNVKEHHRDDFPADVIGLMVNQFGPTYVNRQMVKGLTKKEEEEYLPNLVNSNPGDPTWKKATEDFWNELSVPVKYSTGLALDVSTNEEGKPINLYDWILYKRALASPHVAPDKQTAKSSNKYWFYIYDENEAKVKANKGIKVNTEAVRKYSEIEDKESTLDMLLWMYGDNPNQREDKADKQNTLFEYLTADPKKFLEFCEDQNLDLKSEIYAMVHAGIISKISYTYSFGDNNIGDSIEEVVRYFKDPKNSGFVNGMKGELRKTRKK